MSGAGDWSGIAKSSLLRLVLNSIVRQLLLIFQYTLHMTTLSKYRILLATCAFALAFPAAAQDAGSPETMRNVRAAVEKYYSRNPNYRPTENWLRVIPASTCREPRLPIAFRRAELSGKTVLQYQVNADGKAHNAIIARSSGWAVLDEAALDALSQCVFTNTNSSEWDDQTYIFRIQ